MLSTGVEFAVVAVLAASVFAAAAAVAVVVGAAEFSAGTAVAVVVAYATVLVAAYATVLVAAAESAVVVFVVLALEPGTGHSRQFLSQSAIAPAPTPPVSPRTPAAAAGSLSWQPLGSVWLLVGSVLLQRREPRPEVFQLPLFPVNVLYKYTVA